MFFVVVVFVDDVFDVLFLLLEVGVLCLLVDVCVLFLCVCDGFCLCEMVKLGWCGEQSFKLFVEVLECSWFCVDVCVDGEYFDFVFVLLLCQCDEVCVVFVCVVQFIVFGGVVLVCVLNVEGVKFVQVDFVVMVKQGGQFFKYKCCVFWIVLFNGLYNVVLQVEWFVLDVLCCNVVGYWSCFGLFVWDCIDVVFVLFVVYLLYDFVGYMVDLGVGYGYFVSEVIVCCFGVIVLDGFEVEQRVLDFV